ISPCYPLAVLALRSLASPTMPHYTPDIRDGQSRDAQLRGPFGTPHTYCQPAAHSRYGKTPLGEASMQNGAPAQLRQRDLSPWPKYDAAVLGFRNYWSPVTWSREIGKQPVAFTMLGDRIMFRREGGRVYAFYDQCPHRGIPLSVGRQEFPGTWSCRYHG